MREELRIGTCPHCWGEFKVRDDDQDGHWKLVLHGYERPGTGAIVGRCPGTDVEALEHSCKGLELALAALREELANLAPDGERRGLVEGRIAFAEEMLCDWSRQDIMGVDYKADPNYQPRKPPTSDELSERRKLGLGLRGDLQKARRVQAAREEASQPPSVTIFFEIPDAATRAYRQEDLEQRAPRAETALEHAERHLRWIVRRTELAGDRERHRVAVNKLAAAWFSAHGLNARAASAWSEEDDAGGRMHRSEAKLKDVTWDVVEGVAQLLNDIGTKHERLDTRREVDGRFEQHVVGIEWTVAADTTGAMAEKLGVPPINLAKLKLPKDYLGFGPGSSVDDVPEFMTWDELKGWDGVRHNARTLEWYLDLFSASVDDVRGLWSIPEHLVPFAPWKDEPPIACDQHGNCVVMAEGGGQPEWKTMPLGELLDEDEDGLRRDALGMERGAMRKLLAARAPEFYREGPVHTYVGADGRILLCKPVSATDHTYIDHLILPPLGS